MLDSCDLHGLQTARFLYPCDSPGKNSGMGCHSFSRGSSQPRNWTGISCIAGRFFTNSSYEGSSDYYLKKKESLLGHLSYFVHLLTEAIHVTTAVCRRALWAACPRVTWTPLYPAILTYAHTSKYEVSGLPWWLSGKQSACNAGDWPTQGSKPCFKTWVLKKKIPWRRQWQPVSICLAGKS